MVNLSPAVFFDKDGVLSPMIGNPPHGAWNMREVVFVDGSKYVVRDIQDLGYKTFMVTNQPDKECSDSFLDAMMIMFMDYYGFDDAMFARERNSNYYKPNTGMVNTLVALHDVDVKNSYFVGDRWRDIVCGHNSGMKTIWLKKNESDKYEDETPEEHKNIKPNFECVSLSEVYNIIVGDRK